MAYNSPHPEANAIRCAVATAVSRRLPRVVATGGQPNAATPHKLRFGVAGLIWIAASDAADSQTAVAVPDPTSATEFDALFHELKNWGRWGHGDQIGTLNLITPETRLLATRLIREGHAVSLSRVIQPMQNQSTTTTSSANVGNRHNAERDRTHR